MPKILMKVTEIRLLPEIQTLFPKPRNYDEIKKDIAKRGIQISLTISSNNELVCGYTRHCIAQELGIDDVPVGEPIEFASLNEMKRYSILDNDLRRQMTDLERYECVVKPLLEIERDEAKKRQGARTDLQHQTQTASDVEGKSADIVGQQVGVKIAHSTQNAWNVGESVDIVGEQVGWSGDKVRRMGKIATKAAPEIKEKLNAGELTQQAVLEIVKLDTPVEQLDIVSEFSDTKKITEAVKQKKQKTAKANRLKPKLDRLKELIEQGIHIGSVWSFGKRENYAGDADFHGNSPTQIVENAIGYYTKEGDIVLDPMAGSGTVRDVCQALNRSCLAFDLSPIRDDVIAQDARNMEHVDDESVDFIFWHPPYWQLVKYSNLDSDLSQMNWETFLSSVEQVISECYRVLKPEKFICILTGDCVKEKRFYPISWEIHGIAQKQFTPYGVAIKTTEGSTSQIVKGKTIWAEVAATTHLKIEHDFLLVFRKED